MPGTTISHYFPRAYLNDDNLHHTLGEEFPLCENGNMVFHWADFHETCDAIKQQIGQDPLLKEDFERREYGLSRLKLIPVWIKTPMQIHQTTMFDIYERHILNQSHLIGGLDPFGSIDISFIASTGPFKSMALSECFNKSTYNDFILVSLLNGKLPKRDFRIRLKSKILVEFGHHFAEATLIQLEQLTKHGMLLSIDSDVYLKRVKSSEKIRLLMDTKVLSDAHGLTLPELESHLAPYAFNLLYSSKKEDALEFALTDISVQSSFEFLRTKKVYLFVSHGMLAQNYSKQVDGIKGFVDHARGLVLDHFRVYKRSA